MKRLLVLLLSAALIFTGTTMPVEAKTEEDVDLILEEDEALPEEEEVELVSGEPIAFEIGQPPLAEEPKDTEQSEVTDFYGASDDLGVEKRTQQEIINFIKAHPATENEAATWSEMPSTSAPYKAGKISDTTRISALNMLNTIRYIAGLNADVTSDESYEELAQAGTVVDAAYGQLTHYPKQVSDMDDDFFQLGAKGTSSSNLGRDWGRTTTQLNSHILRGWTGDSDDSNIDRVGHRRWVLNPFMQKTGFGAVQLSHETYRTQSYTAMYALDGSSNLFGASAGSVRVAWPAQLMPVEYFADNDAWSFSTGVEQTAANITVTLTRQSDSKTWTFSGANAGTMEPSEDYINVENSGYGQKGCIIFRPSSISYSAGDVFKVSITGLTGGDANYTVEFFSSGVKLIPVTGVNVYSSFDTLKVGDTQELMCYVTPSNATDSTVTWTSSDETVATVSDTGLVTAVSPGSATITATTRDGGFTATCTVTVTENAEDLQIYNVRFMSNGGSAVPSQTREAGELVTKPSDPTRDGYTFTGWFKDSRLTQAYDFNTLITGNLTLYAGWEVKARSYTIQFHSNGAGWVPNQAHKAGELVDEPDALTRSGYIFAGWYRDTAFTQAWNFSEDTVTGDLLLFAKWEEDPSGEREEGKATLLKGQTIKISYIDSDLSEIKGLKYSTSDKKIASVDKNGKIKGGTKAGIATIKAYTGKGSTLKTEKTITVTNRVPSMPKKVTVTKKNDPVEALELAGVDEYLPVWESSNEKIATIDEDTGEIEILKTGQTKITATITDEDYSIKCTTTLKVSLPKLSKASAKILTGASATFSVSNTKQAVDWKIAIVEDGKETEGYDYEDVSGDAEPDTLTLASSGKNGKKVKVTANEPGTYHLIATIDGEDYFCTITVPEIELKKTAISLKAKKTAKVALKNSKLKLSRFEWKSEDVTVATVDKNGKIKGVAAGETTITGTYLEKEYKISVTVK